ncbi:MAG: hypothetical protein AAGI30_08800 [Planctomycetota bacterium]
MNWPPQDGDVAVHQLGFDPIPDVIAVAVRFVTEEWPAEGRYMVNFPLGTDRAVAERTVRLIGDQDAWRVDPRAIEAGWPAYHITRVWLRGEEATVDVVRPVSTVVGTGVSAEGVTQQVTVRLRAGLGERWGVESARAWTVGAYERPTLYGWPLDDAADQGSGAP